MAKRTLNPAEKARKEARKKELKKNKKLRQQFRASKKPADDSNKTEPLPSQPDSSHEPTNRSLAPPRRPQGPPPADLKSLVDSSKDVRLPPAHSLSNVRPVPMKPSHPDPTPKPSVIESKPIMFVSKVTKFVPSSVRQKINPKQRM